MTTETLKRIAWKQLTHRAQQFIVEFTVQYLYWNTSSHRNTNAVRTCIGVGSHTIYLRRLRYYVFAILKVKVEMEIPVLFSHRIFKPVSLNHGIMVLSVTQKPPYSLVTALVRSVKNSDRLKFKGVEWQNALTIRITSKKASLAHIAYLTLLQFQFQIFGSFY